MADDEFRTDVERAWAGFLHYVRYQRRYVWEDEWLKKIHPSNWLANCEGQTDFLLGQGWQVWRARVQRQGEAWPATPRNLGAPDAYLTRAQRASASGIRVFYGAQDRETAIAEVRPWVGARLYVAPWCAERELRLFDFEAQVQDPETEWAKYLRFVSRSLSYPVEPSANDTQYVITQYLVETIRNLENSRGSDGIRYGSAQKPGGYNIVVFDPGNLQPCGEPDYVEVTEVGYQHAKRDPPPDEAQPVRFALPGWLAGSVGTCAAAKGISREAFVIDAVVAATEDAEDIAIADQRTGDQTDPVVSWDEVRTEMAKGSDRDTPADP